MNMEITSVPYGVKNKWLSKHDLDRYFTAGSLDELIFALREYARNGYLGFEVALSLDYFKWEKAHRDVVLNADALLPPEPFFVAQRSTHGLDSLRDKAEKGTPLTRFEVNDVIGKLPNDLAEKYLRFSLYNIDRDALQEILAAAPNDKPGNKRKAYAALEYNRLMVKDAEVSYHGKLIHMGFQQQQVLRVFMKNPEQLRTKDEFLDDPDIFTRGNYPDIDATLSKLIAATRAKLKKVVGQNCIYSKPNDGWILRIE